MEQTQIAPTPTPSRGQALLRHLGYAVVLAAGAIGLLFVFWILQNPRVLEVKDSPFSVRPPVISQGDVIIVHSTYCKYRNIPGTIIVRLVGKKSIIRVPFPNDARPVGCVQEDTPIAIPSYATNDVYHFEFDISYHVNPLKTQLVNTRSKEFTVQAR